MYSADYTVARCPSVRPTHAGIVSKRPISSNVFTVGSPFFHSEPHGNIPTGTLLTVASNATGYYNSNFRPVSRFISKNECYNKRPELLQNANRKSYPSFRMVTFSMTLSDLEWLSKIFNDIHKRLCIFVPKGAIQIRCYYYNYCYYARSIARSLCYSWAQAQRWTRGSRGPDSPQPRTGTPVRSMQIRTPSYKASQVMNRASSNFQCTFGCGSLDNIWHAETL